MPLPPTPPEPKPLDPPPRALVPSPTLQGILQNTPFFFFLYALETSKIRRKLRNLLRPWGPCPYHLPPGTKALGPLSAPPCTLPHPTGNPSKNIFLLFVRVTNVKNTTQNLLRPWGPCPYHLPPRHRSPWRPPEPQTWGLGASGTLSTRPGLGPCPYHLPPLDPPPRALVPSPTLHGILQKTRFFFFLYALETSKIRHKLRNLLRPWGPRPYHLPPRNQSPWTPPPRALVPSPTYRASFKTRHFSSFCTR